MGRLRQNLGFVFGKFFYRISFFFLWICMHVLGVGHLTVACWLRQHLDLFWHVASAPFPNDGLPIVTNSWVIPFVSSECVTSTN